MTDLFDHPVDHPVDLDSLGYALEHPNICPNPGCENPANGYSTKKRMPGQCSECTKEWQRQYDRERWSASEDYRKKSRTKNKQWLINKRITDPSWFKNQSKTKYEKVKDRMNTDPIYKNEQNRKKREYAYNRNVMLRILLYERDGNALFPSFIKVDKSYLVDTRDFHVDLIICRATLLYCGFPKYLTRETIKNLPNLQLMIFRRNLSKGKKRALDFVIEEGASVIVIKETIKREKRAIDYLLKEYPEGRDALREYYPDLIS